MSSTVITVPTSGRANTYRLTIAYFAAFVFLGLTTGSLGPTLTSLADQTQVGLSAISYVFTARSAGYLFGSVLSGKLFDRRSGNPIMAAMLFIMSIMMALVPLAPRLWLLLITMLLLGAAESGLDVGANTLLGWVHGTRVGPFMNAMHSLFGVGALSAPLIVAQTISLKLPATHSYLFLAALLMPVSLVFLRLPSPVPTARTVAGERAAAKPRQAFLFASFLFLYVGAEVGFAGWIYTYATTLRLSDVNTAAYLTSLFWGALTLGRILTIPIAVRISPESVLISSLAACLMSLALILASPSSFVAVLIGTFCLGVSMAPIFPTTLSLAGRRMTLTGQVTGWFIVAASGGAMLVPLIIGQTFSASGPRLVIVVTTSTLAIAFGVLTFMIRNPKSLEMGAVIYDCVKPENS
jgi:MFS transporter, FHS family, Na+ dependent glucose transporter 1